MEVLSQHLPGGTEKIHEEPAGVESVAAEIRTQHSRIRMYRVAATSARQVSCS
jgi:hypothetical protein